MKDGSKKFAIGTVVAGITGYLAGILTAPKSGKKTREDIQRTTSKAITEAERRLKMLHSELTDLIEKGKKTSEGLQDSAKTQFGVILSAAQTAKEKARNLLSAIHEGDADDKDLQKAIDEVNKSIEHLKRYLTKDDKPAKKSSK